MNNNNRYFKHGWAQRTMGKKVLVLYYSQSGQLGEIINTFVAPLEAAGASIEQVRITPKKDFAFPWNSERFFDAMPESVLSIPSELEPFKLKENKYDLVVFGYQPWFLHLSIPANSILNHPDVQNILRGSNVITVIGARNMWLNSQEKVKALLKQAGANLVGNIALVDKNPNLVSAVTILHWMMGGKKDSYLGIFPKPGVQDEDIANMTVLGKTVNDYLLQGKWQGMQAKLVEQGAAFVESNLMFIEQRAPRLFHIWANLAYKSKNRRTVLVLFKYYLLFALFIVAPIVLTINFVFFRVFFLGANKRKKQYYLGVN